MQASLSKRFIGIAVAIVLAFGMIPALALSAPAKAEAATVTAGTIAKTGATSLSKKGATDLNKLMISGDLKTIINDYKYIKNKNYNKTSLYYTRYGSLYETTDSEQYVAKSLVDYTGKAKKPKVQLFVKDEKATKVYTDKTANPDWYERTFTGYNELKGVVITGKESKKSLKKKIKGKDFTVQYENNKNIGTAQIIIKGVNNYKGTVYDTFSVKMKDIDKVTAKGKSKALKASWTKVKGASGYLVTAAPFVAEKSKYSDYTYYQQCGPKKIMVVSGKKKAAVIKKLMKKTDYIVDVEAFVNVNAGSYKTSEALQWGDGEYNEQADRYVYKNEKVVTNETAYPAQTYWGNFKCTPKLVKTK